MPHAYDDAHAKFQEFMNCRTDANTSFEIPLVNQETIEKEFNGLEDGKTVGLDVFPPKLLQLSDSVISQPLTYILNQSIKTTIFPDEWKTAKVVPLHKKDSTQLRKNFRPISVLSTLSKLLERHIHTHFYRFLVHNNLLHIAQSGFRTMFSCETALANIVNKWEKAIDDELLNGVVLLDLQKAFDLFDHQILLKKLKMNKCSNKTMKWFQSYLNHRSQCTVFKGKVSETSTITYGVLQGSILGPMFFILFINDLPIHIENSDCDMYADDSSVNESHSRDTRTSDHSDLSLPIGKHKDIYINSLCMFVLKFGMIYQQTSKTLCLWKVSNVLT